MAHTFYDGTIVVVQGLLSTLSHILHLAEQSPDTSISTTALLEARLTPDMLPLPDQVRIATQYSENLVARVTGREATTFEAKPASFGDFHARIETVLGAAAGADAQVVNGRADVLGATPLGPGRSAEMSAAAYAHTVALPNIYFHVVTAYGILRKEGVPLGKFDFYAGFFPQYVAGSKK